MVSSEQIRAARALRRWDQKDLSRASGVSLPSIKRLETQPGTLAAQDRTIQTMKHALEKAGVMFLDGEQFRATDAVALRKIDYNLTSQQQYGEWQVMENETDAIQRLRLLWLFVPQGNGTDRFWAACDVEQLVEVGEAIFDREARVWKLRTKVIVFQRSDSGMTTTL